MGDRVLMIPDVLNTFLITLCSTLALQTLSRIQCIQQALITSVLLMLDPDPFPCPSLVPPAHFFWGLDSTYPQLSSLQITEIFIK